VATFETPYGFGDRVLIDGDASIRAVVTAFVFRGGAVLIEVSWISNGASHSERIEDFRLSRAD